MTVLIKSGETSTVYISVEEPLDFSHGHPARVERQNFVVEAGEAARVFLDQPVLERPFAIARHGDRQGPSSVSTVLPLVPLR